MDLHGKTSRAAATVQSATSLIDLVHRRKFGGNTSLNEEAPMAETELQIATREASDQKQAVLRQQSVVLGLKGEGGERLAKATELLESMQEELHIREARLERLVLNA
jgi:hypothetical protein